VRKTGFARANPGRAKIPEGVRFAAACRFELIETPLSAGRAADPEGVRFAAACRFELIETPLSAGRAADP